MTLQVCEKVPTPISGGTSHDKREEPRCRGLREENNHGDESVEALCAVLAKCKMARNTRNAQSVLEFYQLLATRNYKLMVLFGRKEVWIPSLAVLDTGAGRNIVKEYFALAPWDSSIKEVEESRIQSTSKAPMEMKGVLSLEV